jgi:hypothetical protein
MFESQSPIKPAKHAHHAVMWRTADAVLELLRSTLSWKGWKLTAASTSPAAFPALPKGRRNSIRRITMDSLKPERMLSVKEFAHAVGWGEDTVRRMIYRNLIRAIVLPQINPKKHVHRRARIPASEITRFHKRFGNSY